MLQSARWGRQVPAGDGARIAEEELRELRARAERDLCLLRNSSEVGLLLDAAGAIRHAGPSVERILGHLPAALRGQPLLDMVHPDDAARFGAFLLRSAVAAPEDPVEVRLRGADREWVPFEARAGTDTGGEPGLVLCCHEITGRKRAEQELRESEERYALAARGSNDGLWDWDLRTGRIYYSSRWKAMLGHSDDEIGDRPDDWFERIHPADLERVQEEIEGPLQGSSGQVECEYRLFHRDGTYRWVLCRGLAVLDGAGLPCRLIGSQTDVTDRKAAEDRLQHAALHDTLTGLPNRALFTQGLHRSIERAGWGGSTLVAVLYLDLDRFKTINDSLGHHAGDQLLRSFARRLVRCTRAGDTVARLGGDEFAVLLEGIKDLGEAAAVADRIQEELRGPFDLGTQEVFTSASIGIASNVLPRARPEDLLRDADTAMYEAKTLGKARYALFDAGMHARVTLELELDNDLRRAVERNEFVVFYQPVMSVATGGIAGFEALVRWQHPERGLVGPDEFIPIAEENGLIFDIDRHVLFEACRQLGEWQSVAGDECLWISVNLSGCRLTQPDLCHEVARALEQSGLRGEALQLEITETAVIENPEQALRVLGELRAMGVGIAIDDFGTGYSSLSSLYRFPFDTLKIDRSFLVAGETAPGKWELVQTIVTLAQSLRMKVVAEGVECEPQVDGLRDLGCDFGQGYLFSRPLDAEQATAFLRRTLVLPAPVHRPALPDLLAELTAGAH